MPPFNRPPLPPSSCPPAQAVLADPCALLPQLRAQLYAAMGGQVTREIRDGDRWRSTHTPNIVELRKEIRRLEIMCDPRSNARAVRAGPYAPAQPGFGFPFGRNWPY